VTVVVGADAHDPPPPAADVNSVAGTNRLRNLHGHTTGPEQNLPLQVQAACRINGLGVTHRMARFTRAMDVPPAGDLVRLWAGRFSDAV
jgi:hypothetical protein